MKIPFTKAHGTGNDFIIFIKNECPDIISNSNFIQKACSRRTGIGADAVLILSDENNYDFKMDYYNSDGSWETFCANGARCATKLMFQKGIIRKITEFVSGDGHHKAEILENGLVRLKMIPPSYQSEILDIDGYSGRHVDSGARHFATEVTGFSLEKATKFAPKIRYSPEFAPKGINVNFYEKLDKSTIKVITYEKGIEKIMLSCGSGSVAASYHASQNHQFKSPIKVKVRGGELLVEFDENWKNVWLTGPATILFSATIDIENF
ncbi:MAG: diaminopimelate epimerase [Candidatus Marinimicrobia bacterium]|nr:diaminopimelate epimerase [Candidatus Neomarinimicrobiota bacterium]